MNKKILMGAFVVLLFIDGGSSYAVQKRCIGVACAMDYDPINSVPSNCASYTDYCYSSGASFSGSGGTRVYDCTRCNTGYKLDGGTILVDGCSNAIAANGCILDCTGCSNCTSDTTWSATGTAGYEKKVTRTCSCNTCNASTSYRCAAGYYGSSTNGTSGCTRCPSSGGVYGTSAAGSTSVTSCYMPSGTNMSDTSGTYQFTSSCYYTN